MIDAGRLFIAQPPLYKIKLGKSKERYLADAILELREFLVEHGHGQP